MSNVTLRSLSSSNPSDWKTPIYVEFGMLGASFLIFLILPESPCKHQSSNLRHSAY